MKACRIFSKFIVFSTELFNKNLTKLEKKLLEKKNLATVYLFTIFVYVFLYLDAAQFGFSLLLNAYYCTWKH